jgi:hypothetical protein
MDILLHTKFECNSLNVCYRVLMIEAYGSADQVMGYYGTANKSGGHFPFNFRLITDITNTSTAENFSQNITEYLAFMTDGRTPNWVVSVDTALSTNLYSA